MQPTLGGFISWVQTAMGISTTVLPEDSPWLTYAYDVAVALVNQQLAIVGGPIYMLAVYNLGGSNLINWAQDLPGAVVYQNNLPFFAFTRQSLGLLGYVSGTLNATSDQGTSSGFVVPKAAENFTLADLQLTKDPWGRQYLAFAQKYGPIWGLS